MNVRKRIIVTTDCTADLPEIFLEKYGIDIVYFYIKTKSGVFRDLEEITSRNVFEYMQSGGIPETFAPPAEEYAEFFREKLKNSEEIIHISISSGISMSYSNSTEALGILDKSEAERIHIIDSKHISSGTGLIVIRAAEMAAMGRSTADIISEAQALTTRVSSTFIAQNADYLYINGKVSRKVQKICSLLNIHPVLRMKNGTMRLKTVFIGNYDSARRYYVRCEMKKIKKIDKKRLFITHAGCTMKELASVRSELQKYVSFDEICQVNASATVSGNCGPRTVGVLFICNN